MSYLVDKTIFLYQVEAIREAARRAGLPADVIVEVGQMQPSGEVVALQPGMFT